MKVFLASIHCDTAGQQAALRAALKAERPRWVVDQMRYLPSPYGYPTQRAWDPRIARALWYRANVVHLDQGPRLVRQLRINRAVPVVVQHHGSDYRDRREQMDADCRDMTQVVSTLDLLGSPGVDWLPVVADLDALAVLRSERWTPSPTIVRIATSPSDPALKGTAEISAVVARLQAEGLPLELDVISGVSWTECLARKARADVFIDQLELGYGLSAVEAWGMGIPVIAGITDPIVRDRMSTAFGGLPFLDAATIGLEAAIRTLADTADRREWAGRGTDHARRFHSQRAVVARLEPAYERAMRRRAA